jgi:hypothetical protein
MTAERINNSSPFAIDTLMSTFRVRGAEVSLSALDACRCAVLVLMFDWCCDCCCDCCGAAAGAVWLLALVLVFVFVDACCGGGGGAGGSGDSVGRAAARCGCGCGCGIGAVVIAAAAAFCSLTVAIGADGLGGPTDEKCAVMLAETWDVWVVERDGRG